MKWGQITDRVFWWPLNEISIDGDEHCTISIVSNSFRNIEQKMADLMRLQKPIDSHKTNVLQSKRVRKRDRVCTNDTLNVQISCYVIVIDDATLIDSCPLVSISSSRRITCSWMIHAWSKEYWRIFSDISFDIVIVSGCVFGDVFLVTHHIICFLFGRLDQINF